MVYELPLPQFRPPRSPKGLMASPPPRHLSGVCVSVMIADRAWRYVSPGILVPGGALLVIMGHYVLHLFSRNSVEIYRFLEFAITKTKAG